MQGICVPLGDFNEIHSHLFYFNIKHKIGLYYVSKPANHKRIQRYKPLELGQQLGENKDN